MTNYNGKEVLNGLLLIKSMMSVENVERQAIALRKLANKAGVVEHEKRITKGANVYTVNRKEYVDWAIKALTVV